MGKNSKIEWTTHTFNPWWGCTKVSPGCQLCYAERESHRRGHDVWGPGRARRLLSTGHWMEPLRWDREAAKAGVRHRVFCASMADVFDAEAPPGQQERLWALIEATPDLDWQILTKRPERIAECLPPAWVKEPRPNVWLGTSIENADYTWRADALVKVPAVVHFLSVEPLIGPIQALPLDDIEWVILGGESGPRARPCHEPWVLQILDQCEAASVPLHFKQWGEWAPLGALEDPELLERCLRDEIRTDTIEVGGHLSTVYRVAKNPAGRILAGRHWNELPNTTRGNRAAS